MPLAEANHSLSRPSVWMPLAEANNSCCYPIFDPCFDKFSEKSKNSEKTLKIQKIHF
jgi:hypothetical protein